MEKAIEVKGLRKSFKDTEVLKGVDFEVKRGEIFALLGSNGAGKTERSMQICLFLQIRMRLAKNFMIPKDLAKIYNL